MTTTILLDFGGTLDADGVPWATRFFAAYRASGGQVEETEFASLFRKSDEAFGARPDGRRLGFRAMIETQSLLLSRLLPGTPDLRAIAARFYRDSLATIQRNRPVLDELRRRGCRLALVSNFTGNLQCCLDELDLSGYFDAVIDSAVFGWAKPDRRIFVAALEVVGAERQHSWIVGDNPEADVRPAQSLGLRSVWLAPRRRDPPPGVVPTARIASLRGLPNVIRHYERADSRRG